MHRHPVHQDLTPWLDRSAPDWLGCFPGLGSVRVEPDGTVRVELEDGPDPQRERALRLGWGEPLALARRGFHLARGAMLADRQAALLLAGGQAESGPLAAALAGGGRRVLADWLCPLSRPGGRWLAHGRSAPQLLDRNAAAAAAVGGTPVRAGSDALAVPTAGQGLDGPPVPLAGIVHLARRAVREPVGLTPLTGSARLRAAAQLLSDGVLAQPSTEAAELADRQLSLAALPACRLALDLDGLDTALRPVLDWFGQARCGIDADGPG